jgi:hypothetical protein
VECLGPRKDPLLDKSERHFRIGLCNYVVSVHTWQNWCWPLLWPGDQSSWLQTQMSGFDSWHCQLFWYVVGRQSSGFGLDKRECGRRDLSRWSRWTLYPQKVAQTSPTSCGRSVGIVRSLTQATEFSFYFIFYFFNFFSSMCAKRMKSSETKNCMNIMNVTFQFSTAGNSGKR